MSSGLCGLCKPQALEEYFAECLAFKINEIASMKSSNETFAVK